MTRWNIERTGTAVLLVLMVCVVALVGLSILMELAADDLYAADDQAHGISLQHPRAQPGIWLATRLTDDLALSDLANRRLRADQLNYRGDRVRELAGIGAVVGLLVAVVTSRAG